MWPMIADDAKTVWLTVPDITTALRLSTSLIGTIVMMCDLARRIRRRKRPSKQPQDHARNL
jgi:hypothetical protein